MTLSFAERIASEQALLDWMKKHKAEIDRLGGDANLYVRTLEPTVQATIAANTTQEAMKAALKDQTKLLNQSDRTSYKLASSYFDVVTGLYGKGSSEAKQLRRIRSKMRKPTPEKAPK